MKKVLAYIVIFILLLESAGLAGEFRFSPKPNKAHEIQWRSWGPGAFAEAKQADKLVLLSLSAVWCHWCHVMDETTYSDEDIIRLINERFIPVRVDSDLRPDVDSLYNQGGWPSTAFLTPAGEMIDGGNYFPPAEMRARLERAANLYATERDLIATRLEEVRQRRMLRQQGITGTPDLEAIDSIVRLLAGVFDDQFGGFGSGQKFPNPDAVDLLLGRYSVTGDAEARRMAEVTLDRMAAGGIHDQAAGGFFRYATERDWSVPHYEKMLEVNAGLIGNYARAYQVLRKEQYRRVVERAVRYAGRTLRDRESGAFFGSQDADEDYYAAGDRKKRKPPLVDRTTFADSSSLMISALVAAWGATGEEQHLHSAVKAAEVVIAKLYRRGGGVYHSLRRGKASLPGQLDDNALFGMAMLDLYSATGEYRYRVHAVQTGRLITERFYDSREKRFHPSLGSAGVAPVTRGALAEVNNDRANYRASRFLARLSHFTGETKAQETALAALASLSKSYQDFTPHAPSYGLALRWALGEPVELHVLADGKRVREYLAAAAGVYAPEKVVKVLSPAKDRGEIQRLGYPAREAVYICAGKRCSTPVRDPAKLTEELQQFIRGRNSEGR